MLRCRKKKKEDSRAEIANGRREKRNVVHTKSQRKENSRAEIANGRREKRNVVHTKAQRKEDSRAEIAKDAEKEEIWFTQREKVLYKFWWKQFSWRRGQNNFHELEFQVHKSSM